MTKREKAEIILQAIDDFSPATVDFDDKDWWMEAIMKGLTDVEKGETDEES